MVFVVRREPIVQQKTGNIRKDEHKAGQPAASALRLTWVARAWCRMISGLTPAARLHLTQFLGYPVSDEPSSGFHMATLSIAFARATSLSEIAFTR